MDETKVLIEQTENGWIVDSLPGRRVYTDWKEVLKDLHELFDIVQEEKES